MIIYQVHDKHGRHLAYSVLEAEINNQAGWRTVSEEEFSGKKQPSANACPKCGKEFGRGLTMHVKHCKAN